MADTAFYPALTPAEATNLQGVSVESGLTSEEAAKRLHKFGPNELPKEELTPFWKLVLEQFDDQLVKILLAAAVTSFLLALTEDGEDQAQAFTEPVVIMIILILNAIVGVVQESNAEAAIEALKEYETASATVVRDGDTQVVNSATIVPGDVVICAMGTKVPADLLLLKIASSVVTVDQSALTGESVAVSKIDEVTPDEAAVNQDKRNVLFSGTDITRGKVYGMVFATGSKTEIGKISKSLQEDEKTRTPLQQKLDDFGEMLSKVIMWICIAVWLININHFNDPAHGGIWYKGAIYYFKIAVALAVAAIPEGLPAVVTTCLALGTRKMAQKNAIVRSLPSVETLGCTSVICSDKTGTLTTNKMSVQRVMVLGARDGNELHVHGTDYTPKGAITANGMNICHVTQLPAFRMLAVICSSCNESDIHYDADKAVYDRIGEPTEAALRILVEKMGTDNHTFPSSPREAATFACKYFNSTVEKLGTLEFTRARKSMSVLVSMGGKQMLLVKGAPETMLERSSHVLRNDGSVDKLTNQDRQVFEDKLLEYGTGEMTLRNLAMAYVEVKGNVKMDLADPDQFAAYESNMVFVGLVGMIDPPRPEVRDAIAKCHDAGVRVVVITGDNKDTAEAICRRIGVFGPTQDLTGRSYTGKEFSALSEAEQLTAVTSADLFARTEPVHKKLLVERLQQQGYVCAMTGDGVNDAPALKRAEIGIAMGSGTAVAKGAGDMVLADDNFATIVVAVEEGRAIFNNTKQFIRYLISSNIGEVACIFITAALGLPESLIPVQLLWVNLVTDGLPATALGFNKPDADIMRVAPRDSKEGIVDSWLFFRYMVIGIYVGVGTVGGFCWWYMSYEKGPLMGFNDLRGWSTCVDQKFGNGFGCEVFSGVSHESASTMSLSILVTIEMLNAANALSENQSLLVQPIWTNIWLVLAMILSFSLHLMILYWPWMNEIFSVQPLTKDEWLAVVYWSLPVLFLDELLKLAARLKGRGAKNFVKPKSD